MGDQRGSRPRLVTPRLLWRVCCISDFRWIVAPPETLWQYHFLWDRPTIQGEPLRRSNRQRCLRAVLSVTSCRPTAVQTVTSCSGFTKDSKSIRGSVTACCPRRRASLAIDSPQLLLTSAILGIDSLPLTAVCILLGGLMGGQDLSVRGALLLAAAVAAGV